MKIEPSLVPGRNRTGLSAFPDHRSVIDVPQDLGPTSRGSIEQLAAVRARYSRTSAPFGSLPEEPRLERSLFQLVDLLGARLQFERTGVRLYDALIAKRDVFGTFEGGPHRDDLLEIRNEELRHMRLVDQLLHDHGADPTAVTPMANIQELASRGIADVLMDPRTSLLDGLEAMVIAELADHESWTGLVELTQSMGRGDLSRVLQECQRREQEHLARVRRWISAGRGVIAKAISNSG